MNAEEGESKRWSVTPSLVTRKVGGQVFVLMPDSAMHILKNESAMFLFEALESSGPSGASALELSERLVGAFAEVSPERARADVERFVQDLNSLGILRSIE